MLTEFIGAEETKKELEGGTKVKDSLEENPMMNREYAFDISYVNARGDTFTGKFVNRIVDFDDISKIGIVKAKLFGGLPIVCFDDFTVDHNEKIAHLTISLVQRPKWAKDLGKLIDKDVLDLIYRSVAEHEATFSGRSKEEKTSESEN